MSINENNKIKIENNENIEQIADAELKCAEIFIEYINENVSFCITCNYCHKAYKYFDLFKKHIFNHHVEVERNVSISNFTMSSNSKQDEADYSTSSSNIILNRKEHNNNEILLGSYLIDGNIEVDEEYFQDYKTDNILQIVEENKIDGHGIETHRNICGALDNHHNESKQNHSTPNNMHCSLPEKIVLKDEDSKEMDNLIEKYTKICNIKDTTKYQCSMKNGQQMNSLNEIDLNYYPVLLNSQKKYKCNICNFSYIFKESYNIHMREHTGEYLNKPIESLYKRKKNRILNRENHHHNHSKQQENQNLSVTGKIELIDASPINYKCNICGKIYKVLKAFNEHAKIHTGEKQSHPFVCEHCKKTFTRIDYYKYHLNTHTGVRPYRCQYCDRGFAQPGNLKTHVLSHLGKKQYKCAYCDKRFVQSSSKKIHERSIHTKELPFVCDVCGQKLVSRYKLTVHKKSKHSTERPFKCEHCDKGFLTRADLKCHFVSHTNEKPFECKICRKRFPRQKSLRSHEKLHFEEYPGFAIEKVQRLPRRTLKLVVPLDAVNN